MLSVSALAHMDDDRQHQLIDHLTASAALAKQRADAFNAGNWAQLAALWHDLGKYSVEFQRYIRGAASQARGSVDHSTFGGVHAREAFGKSVAIGSA
jgi:CRISPR-associated endonuclease/helicase Cas3